MAINLVNVGDPLDTRAYQTNAFVQEVIPLKDGGYTLIIREAGFQGLDDRQTTLVTVGADGVPVGRAVKLGDINIQEAKALTDGSMLISIESNSGRTVSLATMSKTGAVETFYSAELGSEDGSPYGIPSSTAAFGKDNAIAVARFASDQAGIHRTVDILSPNRKLVASVAIDRNLKSDEAGSTQVKALADGRFLVTWVEEGATRTVVKAQVVTKQGKLEGPVFVAARVDDLGTPGVTQMIYEVAALADGSFAISTQSAESHYDPANPKGSTVVHGNVEGRIWARTEGGTFKAGSSHLTVANSDAASLKAVEGLSDGRFIEIVKVRSAPDGVEQETSLKGYVYDSAGRATGESVDFLHARSAVARVTNFDTVTALDDGRFAVTFTGTQVPFGPTHGTIQTYGLSTAGLVAVKGATSKGDVLKGNATIDLAESIVGFSGNDQLFGFGGNDRLVGDRGRDFLDGGKGADRMEGGLDSDTYVVDHFGDIVIEGANAGTDTVRSSVSHGLTANVENLTLTGTATIDGHGNALNNVLIGNGAANELLGFGGNDTMQGGAGNDTYYVDDGGDRVIEKHGQGNDTIITTVSYTLTNDQSVEVLKSDYYDFEGAKTITLTGNDHNNVLQGHDGANVLNGKGGSDVLTGGRTISGNVFVFDTALGKNNVDRITNFNEHFYSDKIHLDDAIFKSLATGALDFSAFKNTTRGAVDADDRILYNENIGALYYDADGSGKIKAVQFAIVGEVGATTHPELTAFNFIVI